MTISGASVDAIVKKVLLEAHPVGSFYVSADPTDPSTLWGGGMADAAGRDFPDGMR